MGEKKDINKKLALGVLLYISLYLISNLGLSFLVLHFPEYAKFIFSYIKDLPDALSFFSGFLIQETFLLALLFASLLYSLGYYKIFTKINIFFKDQFKWLGWKIFFIYVIGGFFVYIFVNILLLSLLIHFNISIPGFYGKQVVGEFISNLEIFSFWDYLFIALSVTVIGPIVEEIIYRGFVTKILLDNYGAIAGVIISAYLFAFIHFEWAIFGNLFILSLILSYIYYKTKSILYTFAFHFVVNMSVFLIMFLTI